VKDKGMKNKNGFSLTELIIVVAIMSILLGIAGISGKAWLDRYRVESQMKTMFTDLVNARLSAMNQSRTYFVVFSPSAAAATQYTIYEDRDPADMANPAELDGDRVLQIATDSVMKQTTINPVYSVTSDADEIVINARGEVPGAVAPQTIRVIRSFGSSYDCIVVSLTTTRMGAWDGSECDVQ
jgi:prepilin-type N-terminal cleavage/methylation domain-containing protein